VNDFKQKRQAGYVIILPGIEGDSYFNRDIAAGLNDANIPFHVEIYDWTDGILHFLHNLQSPKQHEKQAELIAQKIADYRAEFPDGEVYIIGHSGGAALSLLVLEHLPGDMKIEGTVMLGSAISPVYNVGPACDRVTKHIWNFTSRLDIPFLMLSNLIFKTFDGRRSWCAGWCGFSSESAENERLIEMPYRLRYIWQRNFGGHFGYTSRHFVRKWIAPLLTEPSSDKLPTP